VSNFRAIVRPRVGDKSEQAFFVADAQAREWARETLRLRFPGVTLEGVQKLAPEKRPRVEIHEIVERLVDVILPEPK
jgi:hypothetical protein